MFYYKKKTQKTGTAWLMLSLVTGEVSHSHLHSQKEFIQKTTTTTMHACLHAHVLAAHAADK